MYDILNWFRNPNWQVSHLEGDHYDYNLKISSKAIQHCHDTGKSLTFTKTDNGYPWDIYPYDNGHFFEWATEYPGDWSHPKNYAAYNPPIPGFLRHWDGDQNWQQSHPSVLLDYFQNCNKVHTGADTTTYSYSGPFKHFFGGGVGTLPSIRMNYLWSPVDLEYRYTTQQHGWVLWEYWKKINGTWVIQEHSNHNWVVPGVIAPNFPCLSIP